MDADAPRFVDADVLGVGSTPDVVRLRAINTSILVVMTTMFLSVGKSLSVGDGIDHL